MGLLYYYYCTWTEESCSGLQLAGRGDCRLGTFACKVAGRGEFVCDGVCADGFDGLFGRDLRRFETGYTAVLKVF